MDSINKVGCFSRIIASLVRIVEKLLSTKNAAFLPATLNECTEFSKFDLEYILWLRPLHTAENHGPIMVHTATVSQKRWDLSLLYRTSLIRMEGLS